MCQFYYIIALIDGSSLYSLEKLNQLGMFHKSYMHFLGGITTTKGGTTSPQFTLDCPRLLIISS